MRYQLIFFILLLLDSFELYSQSYTNSEYVIISYEMDRSKDQHGVRTFYWIVPSDSLSSENVSLSPVYFRGFSNDHFNDCLNGDTTFIFTVTEGMDLESLDSYRPGIEELMNTIKDNRKLVQTIIKKWPGGYKETIKVYLTPIRGNFCSCIIGKEDGDRFGYDGHIYLPVDNFSYSDTFWQSERAKNNFLNDFTRSDIRTSSF